jgi:hypothetical protein
MECIYKQSQNATFLFVILWNTMKDFRYSLLIFLKINFIAVLPANRVSDTVYSHRGLADSFYKTGTNIIIDVTCFIILDENGIKTILFSY